MKSHYLPLILLMLASGLLLSVKACDPDQVCSRNGQTRTCYTGAKNTKNIGICRPGKQTCVDLQWSKCRNEVLPEEDILDDGIDQDCSGADLHSWCGDGKCEGIETLDSCPKDCVGECGDGICNHFYENPDNCPSECTDDAYGEYGMYYLGRIGPYWYDDTYGNGGCLSRLMGKGFVIDGRDDWYYWYVYYADAYYFGQLKLASSDTSGEVESCKYTQYGNSASSCGGKTVFDGCWSCPGNNCTINADIECLCTSGCTIYYELRLVSGNNVEYDLCWGFSDCLISMCGDNFCDYFCGETRKSCPKDCK